jgi:hypothetical protein
MSEPTNDELRRQIAERLGYQGIYGHDERLMGFQPNSHWEILPNWPEDLNAAARDCLTRMPDFGLYWLPKAQQWGIYNPQDLFMLEVNPEPARAICLAFVAMEEKKADE